MGCDLGCEGAVAAAEVEDVVGGLGIEPVEDFGGEGGDEGGGCGVGFLGPVVFVGGWRVHVLKMGIRYNSKVDGQGGLVGVGLMSAGACFERKEGSL